MIEIENLTKSYSGTEVLNIPSLKVEKGEVLGVVGNNGAGKTTLFSLALDLIQATSGHVLSKGQDVSKTEAWKMYTSAFLDDSFLINFLTPEEYFDFVGGLFDVSPEDVRKTLEPFAEIFAGEVMGSKKFIRQLSMGNRKKVGLAAALIGNPELVIWDEPFSSLDPSTQMRVRNVISRESENKTFLLSPRAARKNCSLTLKWRGKCTTFGRAEKG
ncbi:MAG: ABC transporter ATP-binding protein [Flavobacteriales bacterium]|nr:ABC transporter ATP-binding protein [Flavobacteriales bacterium]